MLSIVLSEILLECPICNNPLSIPVLQCINGHLLCSSCCERVNQKCPTCTRKVERIRCRGLENVLKAIKVSCTYNNNGCPERISYSSKYAHELTCSYMPCGCPFTTCHFVGSHKSLATHMNTKHGKSVVRMRFDRVVRFPMSLTDEFVVFREEGEGKIFFLNKHDRMSISCVNDKSERFAYALVVRGKNSSVRFQSLTVRFKKAGKGVVDCSSKDFIQVPSYLAVNNGSLNLELCIWSKGSPSVNIDGDINGES